MDWINDNNYEEDKASLPEFLLWLIKGIEIEENRGQRTVAQHGYSQLGNSELYAKEITYIRNGKTKCIYVYILTVQGAMPAMRYRVGKLSANMREWLDGMFQAGGWQWQNAAG